MKRTFVGSTVAMVILMVAGCGGIKTDTEELGQKMVRIINDEAKAYELLANNSASKAEIERCHERLEKLDQEKKEVNAAMKNLSEADAQALHDKFKTAWAEAAERSFTARAKWAENQKKAKAEK